MSYFSGNHFAGNYWKGRYWRAIGAVGKAAFHATLAVARRFIQLLSRANTIDLPKRKAITLSPMNSTVIMVRQNRNIVMTHEARILFDQQQANQVIKK